MPRPEYARGITRAALRAVPAGMRAVERRQRVPAEAVPEVAALVSSWELKRRAGFEVPDLAPSPGADGVLATRVLGIRFREPVRVIWADGRGFGYETRRGHPLYGEESFSISEDGEFVVRSVSQPASMFWRLASPLLRVLQQRALSRYLSVVHDEAQRGARS